MSIGRNNARRRRVILEEAVQQSKVEATPSRRAKNDKSVVDLKNSYSSAAKRRGQLKITDLIPKRPLPVGLVIGTVLVVFIAINLLAYFSNGWTELSSEAVHTLGLSGVGTLSAWFSSLLFLITGMASLQIYGMRKHRCDDYSGHYQVWLVLAVLFSVASINCVVDLKSVITSLMRSYGFSGKNSFVILLLVKMVALTTLVVRGVLEIRASRAAFLTVIVVWVAYASAVISQIPGVESRLVQNDDMIYGNLNLVGTISVFLSVMFYARFVYLHANDLIKVESSFAAPGLDAEKSDAVVLDGEERVSGRAEETQTEGKSPENILKLSVEKASAKTSRKQRKSQKQRRKAA